MLKDLVKRGWWKLTGVPHVNTIHGHCRCDELERRDGEHEDHRAKASWTEYWKSGELVHRSVHIQLKQGIDLSGTQSNLGS